MGKFDNQVIVITGGSSGIGKATALAFAKEGAKVAIASRNIEQGKATLQELKVIGTKALFIQTDIRKEAEVENLINKTVETFGSLDYAFNNAGTLGMLGDVRDDSSENWNQIMETNLKGIWLSMKYEINQMLKQGHGAIVNNASIAGLIGSRNAGVENIKPQRNVAFYCASKHGVIGLTKSLALEYAQSGIRINAICPAGVETEMFKRLVGDSEDTKAKIAAAHPIGRISQPKEIADAVLWLCSDTASFVLGHSLVLDGGLTIQ